MFCQKCGQQNPETGKFCRACGTDLGNVTQALTGSEPTQPLDRKGRPLNWEGALTTMFMGAAFLTVSIILGLSGKAPGWWFWMLIPAFGMLGSGIAKYVQLKKLEQSQGVNLPAATMRIVSSGQSRPVGTLPPQQTEFVSPDSRYKTGDLVPPSVTDSTTRHLELDSEGQTMTLPKE
jgi:hypothetical protein